VSAKTPRWLDLVAFLLDHRRPVTRAQIFERVRGYDGAAETARRKFERDKDELRGLGIEIETVPLPQSAGDVDQVGYRLRHRKAYLPYLELVDEPPDARPYPGLDQVVLSRAELEVLDHATRALAEQGASALSAAAASARRKLAFDLPLETDSIKRILAAPLPDHVRNALAVLQDAVIEHVAVACRYFTMSRGVEEERVLEPWGLLFQWSRWYCVARARDRDEPRLFRVDRMSDIRALGDEDAHFEVPRDFDVRSYVGHSPWEYGSDTPVLATVRFEFPESRQVLNRRMGQLVLLEENQAVVVRFSVRDRDAFSRWLLSFGRRAELLDPAPLRDSLDALRADVAAMYAEAIP
jgi:predicted DNA-binding transcriptional regulator YafY